ncbi:MAG: amino acid dehydrogenase [Gammaproteobacteria bacterium]|nr:amino acid dehydrogenase [Gammaproteobacteria bacterium]
MQNLNHEAPSSIGDDVLNYALRHKFGDIHCKVDPASGMQAIIAIHNTKFGPALGGCRFIEYDNSNLAFFDVMRLARGMSYKSALAGLPLGGGKAVIIKPKTPFDRKAYFHAFGKFLQEVNGRYITAMDSGTELSDMAIIAEHSSFVASLASEDGDPAHATSLGVLRGIQAAVAYQLKRNDLDGITVAIQGLGHVGYLLAQQLHDLGAKLIVADVDPLRTQHVVEEFGAKAVDTKEIHKIPCDVLSPCALGAVFDENTIPQLQTKIIAGSANNQLAHRFHGQLLHDKGVLYAPDYVISAGGVIFACGKYFHTAEDVVNKNVDRIHESLTEIFTRSIKENKPTSDIADAMAEALLQD